MNTAIVLLKSLKLKKFAEALVILGAVLQLCLWVIPGTIAIRQILLALTLLPSIFFLSSHLRHHGLNRLRALPILLLFCLLLWVLAHLFFFSYDQTLELKQLSSLWLRAIVGIVIGFSLGIILRGSPRGRLAFFVGLFATSLINLAIYVYQSYLQGNWIAPNSFVTTYYFNKIEAAYFGGIAIAVSVAQILLILKNELTLKSWLTLILWVIGIGVALLSSLVSSSKNGIAIGIYLCSMLVIGVTWRVIFSKANRLKSLAIMFFFCVAISSVWITHKSSASQGWNTLFEDIRIAIQIDKYPQWKTNTGLPYPINDSGKTVALNTYERFSWATVGATLIAKYPLGYGLINNSFKKVLDLDGVSHNVPGQAHSGWIDFGLAYGVPGIGLLFLCLLLMIIFGLNSQDEYSFMAAWLALMLITFCLIAEMSYKQYFESMLFFIALGCSWLYSHGFERK